MSALPLNRLAGFSLIELMVAITILGIAMALGMPSYRAWIQNTQIRNAAESIQNGLQKARAESVRRNTNVEFVLGGTPPWEIRLSAASSIESATTEGFKNATITATPTSTITFNSLGRVGALPPNLNADGSAPLSQVDIDSAILPGESRDLRVTINTTNGSVRMCDPNLAAGSGPRACN